VGQSLRRSAFWSIATVGLLILGAIIATVSGASNTAERWGADEAAPVGSRALVEVLRAKGVEVVVTSTLTETLGALEGARTPASASTSAGDPRSATLFVGDTRALLTPEQWSQLAGVADHLVIAEPDAVALDALRIDALSAGPLSADPLSADDDAPTLSLDGDAITLTADCRVAAAQRADTIAASGQGYSTLAGEACFDSGETGSALVQLEVNGAVVTVLGAGNVLQNNDITRSGNAALALGLLGEHPTVVWYQPTPADLSSPTLGELTPQWVNPIAWLLLTAAIVAAFWRGRRFGPLVIENLPVVVKTTETMEGRARLYARAGSRLRAIDALRVGTLRRVADGLALGRGAGLDDIITAVAAITFRDARALRRLLLEDEPGTDRELLQLSDQLRALEEHIARRVRLDEPGTPPAAAPPSERAPTPTRTPSPTSEPPRMEP
jgi:hypothetical protein